MSNSSNAVLPAVTAPVSASVSAPASTNAANEQDSGIDAHYAQYITTMLAAVRTAIDKDKSDTETKSKINDKLQGVLNESERSKLQWNMTPLPYRDLLFVEFKYRTFPMSMYIKRATAVTMNEANAKDLLPPPYPEIPDFAHRCWRHVIAQYGRFIDRLDAWQEEHTSFDNQLLESENREKRRRGVHFLVTGEEREEEDNPEPKRRKVGGSNKDKAKK